MAGIEGAVRGSDASSALHFAVFNDFSDGIAIQNREGEILWMNERLGEMIGRPSPLLGGTDAVAFMLSHFAPAEELSLLFPLLLKTTYENGLSLRGIPCRTTYGGVEVCYSSQMMGTGMFAGLRLNTFRLRDPPRPSPSRLMPFPVKESACGSSFPQAR
jgi:hypothetical protein